MCVPHCLFNRGLWIFKQHQLLHAVIVLAPFGLLNPGKCISALPYWQYKRVCVFLCESIYWKWKSHNTGEHAITTVGTCHGCIVVGDVCELSCEILKVGRTFTVSSSHTFMLPGSPAAASLPLSDAKLRHQSKPAWLNYERAPSLRSTSQIWRDTCRPQLAPRWEKPQRLATVKWAPG